MDGGPRTGAAKGPRRNRTWLQQPMKPSGTASPATRAAAVAVAAAAARRNSQSRAASQRARRDAGETQTEPTRVRHGASDRIQGHRQVPHTPMRARRRARQARRVEGANAARIRAQVVHGFDRPDQNGTACGRRRQNPRRARHLSASADRGASFDREQARAWARARRQVQVRAEAQARVHATTATHVRPAKPAGAPALKTWGLRGAHGADETKAPNGWQRVAPACHKERTKRTTGEPKTLPHERQQKRQRTCAE